MEQADRGREAGGPRCSLPANAHQADSQAFPLVPSPDGVGQERPTGCAAQPRAFLWGASARLPRDPSNTPPLIAVEENKETDFIISLGLLCSAVGHLNGIIISGDNGLGEVDEGTFI